MRLQIVLSSGTHWKFQIDSRFLSSLPSFRFLLSNISINSDFILELSWPTVSRSFNYIKNPCKWNINSTEFQTNDSLQRSLNDLFHPKSAILIRKFQEATALKIGFYRNTTVVLNLTLLNHCAAKYHFTERKWDPWQNRSTLLNAMIYLHLSHRHTQNRTNSFSVGWKGRRIF